MGYVDQAPRAPRTPPRSAGGAQRTVLEQVGPDVAARTGRFQLMGRYHQQPREVADDYEVTSQALGHGSHGEVFLGRSRPSPQGHQREVAVKTLPLRTDADGQLSPDRQAQLESEARIFLCVDHPHIVRLHDVYESSKYVCFVMECLSGGELYDKVIEQRKLSAAASADIVKQILLALAYLHARGIAHRDVKLENFIFDAKGSNHIKLIDFGLSAMNDSRMTERCGTVEYVAPEVLDGPYTTQCDLWSLGVVAFILLSGQMPWKGSAEAVQGKIKRGDYRMDPRAWDVVPTAARDFVRALLNTDPRSRPNARQALQHRWLAGDQAGSKAEASAVDPKVLAALGAYPDASILKRCASSMMAWSLSAEEHATVRDQFLALDKENAGSISVQDLQLAMTERGQRQTCDLGDVFSCFAGLHGGTADESGPTIEYSDFLAAMIHASLVPHQDLVRETFNRFDVNGSQGITAHKLHHLLGDTFEADDMDRLLDEADLKASRTVSYTDFSAYLQGIRKSPLAPPGGRYPPGGGGRYGSPPDWNPSSAYDPEGLSGKRSCCVGAAPECVVQ